MSKAKAAAMGLALATLAGLLFWLWHRLKERLEGKWVS